MIRGFRYQVILIYLLLWTTIAAGHFLLLSNLYDLAMMQALSDSLIFNTIFCMMGVGLWFIVEYTVNDARSGWEELIRQVTMGAAFLLVWTGVSDYLLNTLYEDDNVYLSFLNATLSIRIVTGIMYYCVMITLFYLLIKNRQLKEKKEYEEQLTGQLREAELNMLRSQIRPHFLFNSLNSISALTLTDPARAHEMIIKLSDFMRYSLTYQGETMSTLEKELYHIRLFLDIEKIRFGEKLKVEYDICEECKAWPVPAMILQPIIENAVKHGLYEATAPAGLLVHAGKEESGMMTVRIVNAFDPDVVQRKGTGMGLLNVRKRLATVYKQHNLMNTVKDHEQFTVLINFPYHG